MSKLIVGSIVLVVLLASSDLFTSGMDASERTRPFQIGVLTESWGPTPWSVGLRDGLDELGYREHVDFVLGVRFTQGDLMALPKAARELVELGVDLIFVASAAPWKAAQGATTQLPIVFAGLSDPVGLGLVESFARPGGNTTGVTNLGIELSPKRLEIFQELIPSLKRVLFLYVPTDAVAVAQAKMYREAGRRLGIELVERAVRTEAEALAGFDQVRKDKIDGILTPVNVALNIPGLAAEAATQQGIPIMFDAAFWVERGGLASYGPDYYAAGKQAARLVDKIMKGANPADIPVETNPKIEFAINLKTAKALGLTIPPEMLYRADRLVR
jgi:putative ABC transport system substrate-binding protein